MNPLSTLYIQQVQFLVLLYFRTLPSIITSPLNFRYRQDFKVHVDNNNNMYYNIDLMQIVVLQPYNVLNVNQIVRLAHANRTI